MATEEQHTQELPRLDEFPADAHAAAQGDDPFAQRPEIFVGAAFVGGIALAQLVKVLRR